MTSLRWILAGRPTLQSAAVWSAASTGTRLLVGFLSIKVTAVYLGPAGLALVGQLGNFISLLQSTLGNAVNSAVVKIAAESESRDPERAAAVVGTALRMILWISVGAAILILLLHGPLTVWLLDDVAFAPVLIGLALSLPLVMIGTLAVAVFTAQRLFALVSLTNIIATSGGTLIFVSLCWLYGLWGGLIGIIATYPLTWFVAATLSRRNSRANVLTYWRDASWKCVRPIASFYPMLLTHSVALPLSVLLVRDMLIGEFGAQQTGFWQASFRLSDMYTIIFIAALSMYSLPTLSAANGSEQFRAVLRQLVGVCFTVAAGGALLLYLGRELVVQIVFTHEFAPVSRLWSWQLLGDVFLIAGWPMRSALMASGRAKTYMLVEASIGIGFVVITKALLECAGLLSANIAHAIVWITVFAVLIVLHRHAFLPSKAGVT
jgi:PST family polysaccharide transporter